MDFVDFTDFETSNSFCENCGEAIYPGSPHTFCLEETKLKSYYQCIFCLEDERIGDHSECQERIVKFRNELISFFKKK